MNNDVICVIPARGGSKRISRKNMKLFHGLPIIQYSINTAIGSNIFKDIYVYSDCNQIKSLSTNIGANCGIDRNSNISDDYTTLSETLLEFLNSFLKKKKYLPLYVCCLLPTAPLLKPQRLISAFELLSKENADSIYPIVEFSYPVQRGLTLNNSGYLERKWPEFERSRSQDLPPLYHDAGQFYFIKSEAFLRYNSFIMPRTIPIKMKKIEVQDIDTIEDWEIAELKYQYLKNINEG